MKLFRRQGRRGSTLIEFTLVGIPAIILTTSIVTCSIDMWQLYTLSYAVGQTARYAAMHGSDCVSPNSCAIARSEVGAFFSRQALALAAASTTLIMNDGSGEVTCSPVTSCPSPTSQFPSNGHNSPATPDQITIKATYRLINPLFLFWPGAGSLGATRFTVGATAKQQVIF
jgi:Flp pilus assembly protein TadG